MNQPMNQQTSAEIICNYVSLFNAAQAAEVFLSPHIASELLIMATAEAGPSMWIINRSDVFDGTLEMMTRHPIPEMARRAAEKLMKRRHPNSGAIPPALELQIEEIHDSSVEDILGHPLAPWEAINFFATDTNPAHRASAALSLTRRLLEFPPDAASEALWMNRLKSTYADRLINDTSHYVRSYSARIPFWDADVLAEAISKEEDALVMGRLLQHPNVKTHNVEAALTNKSREVFNNGHIQTIGALDSRISPDIRKMIESEIANPSNFISAIHSWYLKA
jgi:hypothetical protein